MAKPTLQKIIPFLWYAKQAEDAARFYASVFPDSRVDRVTTLAAETPSGPPGSVQVVELTLLGQAFTVMSAARNEPFNHAISFTVMCEDQPEIDRYTEALSRGGAIEPCGWVRDRFGVSWQITPRALGDMMASPDRDRARRVTEAMLGMHKLDLAALRAAGSVSDRR